MLKVYSAEWCPHCHQTEQFLERKGIPFQSINIEAQNDEVVQKVVEINGGDDWVVPTLEYQGKWRPGKVFSAEELLKDLAEMGVIEASTN
ncbi:MAG: glutaredoxin family protein [Pseudomonadales bacterium]|nr:glutaredoxin family protein [Pseudomonadales bacterium]